MSALHQENGSPLSLGKQLRRRIQPEILFTICPLRWCAVGLCNCVRFFVLIFTLIFNFSLIVISWMYHNENGTTGANGPSGEIARHYKVIHTVILSIECSLFGLFVLAVACDQVCIKSINNLLLIYLDASNIFRRNNH